MHVCHLQINGFRGIESAAITFSEHCVLLGANNVGKSSIIDALGLVLGRDRLVRTLGDYDFFGGLPTPKSRIRIVATITGFEPNQPEQHLDWFSPKDCSIPFWWDGFSVSAGEQKEGSQLCTQIAFVARFDNESLEVETIRYFLDGDGDPFEHDVSKVKLGQLKDIGFFLLPSHRTWDRVVSFGSELFRRVLRLQGAIPSKAVTDLRESLRNPNVKLEQDEQIKELVERIDAEIDGFIGTDSSGLQFRPTAGDIESILQALTPHLPGRAESILPVSKHGSGLISLQTLLLLFEFGRSRHHEGKNFILAAEEPELHLHPGHHSRLVARIRGTSNQSITTTHSPEIAAYYQPNEVLILRNRSGQMDAIPLIPSGDKVPDKNALMQLYTLYRAAICEALMHQTILVPEGKTEFQWFRSLLRLRVTIEGWENTCEGNEALGIIPTPDAQVVPIYRRFHSLVPRVVPIVDGDKAGNDYLTELIKSDPPPKLILQLKADCLLEDLIAWILSPVESSEWEAIEMILPISNRTNVELVAVLTKNKTNWRLHEELLVYMGTNQNVNSRLCTFCDGLCEVAVAGHTKESCWHRDDEKSDDSTATWRWQPIAGGT
jgi:putative ATP-dependent endonuclease of the OLD family